MTKSQAEGVFWVLAGCAMCFMGAGVATALVIFAVAPDGFY